MLNASGRADRVARRENGRRGAVGKMGQSDDYRVALGTLSEEMISTGSAKCVFQTEFNNKPILV